MITRYELYDDGFDNYHMKSTTTGEYVLFDDHEAENNRLRKALKQMIHLEYHWEDLSHYGPARLDGLRIAADIAREALQGERDD